MPEIEVIPLESEVEIGPLDNPILGRVVAINILSGMRIRYSVAWWKEGSRQELELDPFEVRPKLKHRTSIGFRSNGP